MEFSDGIFDPQFKIHKLHPKFHLIHLGEIIDLKSKFDKTMNQSPRLIKNKKLLQLISNENKIKDLQETYNFHKVHHPYCPVLPKIYSEIQKRKKVDKPVKIFPGLKPRYSRQTISVTPDPRLKYSNTLIINSLKIQHSRKLS